MELPTKQGPSHLIGEVRQRELGPNWEAESRTTETEALELGFQGVLASILHVGSITVSLQPWSLNCSSCRETVEKSEMESGYQHNIECVGLREPLNKRYFLLNSEERGRRNVQSACCHPGLYS